MDRHLVGDGGDGVYRVYGDFEAANGDHLTFFIEGVFDPVTLAIIHEDFQFTGGTGRFVSAEGTADTMLIRDSDGLITGVLMWGTISFDASDRSH